MAIPEIPTVFNKFPNAVIGNGDNIVLPKMSEAPDYEAEFAFIIGKTGKHINGENWREIPAMRGRAMRSLSQSASDPNVMAIAASITADVA